MPIVKRRVAASFIVGLCALAITIFVPQPTYVVAQTAINARLCQDELGASLTVASPANNSAHNTLPILVSGTVSQVSQIKVFVDGVLQKNVSVDPNDISFSFPINVGQGSHTVHLEATDLCSVTVPTSDFRVSFLPDMINAGGSVSRGSVSDSQRGASASEPIAAPDIGVSSEEFAREGVVDHLLDGLYRGLIDLDIIYPGQTDDIGKSVGRVFLTTTGLGMIVLSKPFFVFSAFLSRRVSSRIASATPLTNNKATILGIRIVGLVLSAAGLIALR